MPAHTPGPRRQECDCHDSGYGVEHCPLHAAAPRMLQTLETIASMTFEDAVQGIALIQAMAQAVLKETER